jgi:hypothetical protein
MKNGTVLRYTSNQRFKEVGTRQSQKARQAMKHEHDMDLVESRIPTHRTMNLQNYIRYLLAVRADWKVPREFYSHPAHTKWNAFVNGQKSESKLLDNMRKKYGRITLL